MYKIINSLESDHYVNDLDFVVNRVTFDPLHGSTILITGGLGLVCSSIVDLLLRYNKKYRSKIHIIIAARNKNDFYYKYGKYGCDVSFLQYDAMNKFDSKIIPDFIIHGAGIASPNLYIQKPCETILSNFIGIFELLKFAQKNKGIKRLLYISSSEVYGKKTNSRSFVEGQYGTVDIDNIRSCYPVAKQSSEMICKAFFSEYSLDVVICRPGHIFGPNVSMNDKRITSDFLIKASCGKKIELLSSGNQLRSFCYTINSAVAILTVLCHGNTGVSYNIGGNEIMSIKDMAMIIAEVAGVDLCSRIPSCNETQSFNPMDNSALDITKLKELGYNDFFTIREGLEHSVIALKELLKKDNP